MYLNAYKLQELIYLFMFFYPSFFPVFWKILFMVFYIDYALTVVPIFFSPLSPLPPAPTHPLAFPTS